MPVLTQVDKQTNECKDCLFRLTASVSLFVCRNSHDSYRSLYTDPPCFVRTGGQLPPAQIVIVVIFFDENVNYHRKTKKYKVICQLHSYLSVCSEIIGIKSNIFDPWIISKEAPVLILDLRIKDLLSWRWWHKWALVLLVSLSCGHQDV